MPNDRDRAFARVALRTPFVAEVVRDRRFVRRLCSPLYGFIGHSSKIGLGEPMKEHRIKAEKGTLLWASMMLLSAGVVAVIDKDYLHGAVLIVLSLVLTFLREHFKFRRWGHTSYWRGERVGGSRR